MTKIIQSKELTAFYNAYNDWLEAGAPDKNEYSFSRRDGLCFLLYQFFDKVGETCDNACRISKEMKNQFVSAQSEVYPFGMSNYYERAKNNTQHLDPIRIRWVKAHLTEEVEKEFTFRR